MWLIFGDTDDIMFWWTSLPRSAPREKSLPSASAPAPVRPAPVPRAPHTPGSVAPRQHHPQGRNPAPVSQASAPVPREIEWSLRKLIESMKSTFFPQGNDDALRISILSASTIRDPFIVLRASEGTLIVGTGFSAVHAWGKSYASFPDMRLPYSERDHLMGWLLSEPGFDIVPFQMILETLGFPHVYGTRDVIAYIRDNIKDTVFLDRCRFFELFSPGTSDRKIGEYHLEDTQWGMMITAGASSFFLPSRTLPKPHTSALSLMMTDGGYSFIWTEDISYVSGEIIEIQKGKISKHFLKFTFDTFYIDKNSIGVVAGYTLWDREILAENGVLTFVLEEDMQSRAIIWHIFIDSRGFVHSHEMMTVHKEILKWIRHTYEQTILANNRIERSELVHTLRRELTKYCYLVTGRTPVVMPVIIER